MKKLRFNIYKILIFIGIIGGTLGIATLIISLFPSFDKFAVFSAFFFPVLGWWAKLEAELSKKSEDYKILEAQMESQDKIHSIALTELQGRFEFLNLRIDQVVEFEMIKNKVEANSEEIREIEGFLGRQGFKKRQHSIITFARKDCPQIKFCNPNQQDNNDIPTSENEREFD